VDTSWLEDVESERVELEVAVLSSVELDTVAVALTDTGGAASLYDAVDEAEAVTAMPAIQSQCCTPLPATVALAKRLQELLK